MAVIIKECKVYPRNGLQYITDILPKRKRIELPAQLKMNDSEIRRCLSYADVYEVVSADKDVLLTMKNFLADNSKAEAATDVPDVELTKPLEEVVEEEIVEEVPEEEPNQEQATTDTAQTVNVVDNEDEYE